MIKRVTPLPKGRCVSESNSLVIIRTLRESFSNLCIKDKDKSSMSQANSFLKYIVISNIVIVMNVANIPGHYFMNFFLCNNAPINVSVSANTHAQSQTFPVHAPSIIHPSF